jgi:hypothetical protein
MATAHATADTDYAGYVSPVDAGRLVGIARRQHSWPGHADPTAGVQGHVLGYVTSSLWDRPERRLSAR